MTGWRHTLCQILGAGLVSLAACAPGEQQQPSPCAQRAAANPQPTPMTALELSGAGVARPTTVTLAQLRAMPMTRLDEVYLQRSHAPDRTTSWCGPSLRSLLELAEVHSGPMRITFEAADGYRVHCRLDELDAAIIALQDGQGRWLADLDAACPARLVPPGKTGNYWIMNPTRITVEPLENE